MYSRNRLCITAKEQAQIRRFRIVLAGAGLGSVIAECALRLGFEDITIIDGDTVELSNLNRQNYTRADIGKPKAQALAQRLQSINPQARLTACCQYIDAGNMAQLIENADVVINAIDFTSDAPFLLDRLCTELGITALHPYNFGWAACVFAVGKWSKNLSHLSENYRGFELTFARFVAKELQKQNRPAEWINELIEQYAGEPEQLPPPQLPIASWQVAGVCTDILYRLATGKEIKMFPEFYFQTIRY
ncbi:MAG: ThiF family adenylyltransferase [Prevotellaceae bacterium]|jgi:hypothetical protein|nr:ThiF family adenylyltransferase [Prevotellaceae bacterium]